MWFRNVRKEKELIDRELEVYRKEKMAEITLDIASAEEYRKEKMAEITLDIASAEEKGARQERDYECGWHNRREQREIEIATLDAKKETYKSGLEKEIEVYKIQYKAVLEAKESHIDSLEEANSQLTAALAAAIAKIQPTQVIK